jgi:hypothetical protein
LGTLEYNRVGLTIYIFAPLKQQLQMHQKEEKLTENQTTPLVSEIPTEHQSIKKTQVCS